MYFFNINGLIRDLRAGKVSQRELYKYSIGVGLISIMTIGQWLYEWGNLAPHAQLAEKIGPNVQPSAIPLYLQILAVLATLAAYFGIFYYYNYVRGNGKDGLKRFVSIYWIVSFILMVSGLIAAIVLGVVYRPLFGYFMRQVPLQLAINAPFIALEKMASYYNIVLLISVLIYLSAMILFAWAMHKVTAKK